MYRSFNSSNYRIYSFYLYEVMCMTNKDLDRLLELKQDLDSSVYEEYQGQVADEFNSLKAKIEGDLHNRRDDLDELLSEEFPKITNRVVELEQQNKELKQKLEKIKEYLPKILARKEVDNDIIIPSRNEIYNELKAILDEDFTNEESK